MLRGAKQTSAKNASQRLVPLVIFTIGGQAFAMKAAEVGSVEPWPVSMRLPGTTPHLHEIVRRGTRLHAVHDLAALWGLTAESEQPLCVMVKWGREEVAVRVDSQIPSLESADLAMIRMVPDSRPGTVGFWSHRGVDIPLISYQSLAQRTAQAA